MRLNLLAAALVAASAGCAHASVINIDGTSSTGTVVNLAAGTYNVTYVGIAGGGLYDGYSLQTNNGTPVSFTDELSITLGAATNFGTSATYDYQVNNVQQVYGSAALALAAYQSALASGTLSLSASYQPQNYTTTVNKIAFTLASAGSVTFTAPDVYYPDNTGGVSINLTQVPEPASMALLGTGLLGLIMARRRYLA